MTTLKAPLVSARADLLSTLLFVLSSLLVGLVLIVAPWTPLWDTNYLLQPHPTLKAWALSAFTRGGVSGLGLVNILLAMDEARAYFEGRDDEP